MVYFKLQKQYISGCESEKGFWETESVLLLPRVRTTTDQVGNIILEKGIKPFPQTQNFLIPISLKPNGINYWYFKFRLSDLIEFKVLDI